ncbi:MAG: hypothetical protein LAT84_08380 [Balneolia bacterium]|nr:hypothetical protein [Balneolia bacterium]
MQASLSVFMKGLIDYAGLFPPSALEMKPAIENFLSYRTTPDADKLSAFVIPSGRLSELNGFSDSFADDPGRPVPFSALAGGGNTVHECITNIEGALQQIHYFYEAQRGSVSVTSMEIKLPDADFTDVELAGLLTDIRSRVNAQIPNSVDLFYEPVRNENWQDRVSVLTTALSGHLSSDDGKSGFKLRCGGVEAHMFPTVHQVAVALFSCRKTGVPFKATAGLHHPVRHHNAQIGCMMHGFFNVFGAAVLGSVYGWTVTEYESMLNEEEPSTFVFSEDGFSWNGFEASMDQLGSVRSSLATSYGSCSFNEPLEDLEELGLRKA